MGIWDTTPLNTGEGILPIFFKTASAPPEEPQLEPCQTGPNSNKRCLVKKSLVSDVPL